MQSHTQEDEADEFSFLNDNGKFGPPPRQREIIRKVHPTLTSLTTNVFRYQGGRFEISKECSTPLAALMRDCWQTLPESRPPFTSILERLIDIYLDTCMPLEL
jgi:hypothetical protein